MENVNVDIKKSRILLNEGIFDYIINNFIPAPRREAQELYRTGRTTFVQKDGQGAHQQSNNNIEDKAKKVEESKVEILDAETNKVSITNKEDSSITDVTVSFFQPQYMSQPKECGKMAKLKK